MDPDPGDVLRSGESHMLPRLAAVGGFVDPVPLLDVTAQLGLPHADVHHVGVSLTDLHGPHRSTVYLPVGYRSPGGTAVGGLPQAPARGAEVVLQEPRATPRHSGRSAAAVGTDTLPLKCVVERGVVLHARLRLSRSRHHRHEQGRSAGETPARHRRHSHGTESPSVDNDRSKRRILSGRPRERQ